LNQNESGFFLYEVHRSEVHSLFALDVFDEYRMMSLTSVALSHLSITESHDHHASKIFTIKTSNCQQTRTIFASQESQRQQESVGVTLKNTCLCEKAGSDQSADLCHNITKVYTFKLLTYSLLYIADTNIQVCVHWG